MITAITALLRKKSLLHFLSDIKIEHSIFALPFATVAIFYTKPQFFDLNTATFLLACMVSARTFAMGINRYLDRFIDAKNPRTKNRKIPSGLLTARAALFWSLVAGLLFMLASYQLNKLAFYLSPLVLIILAIYPLLKRHTMLCHFYLGTCLGISVLAVEVALAGKLSLPIILLGLGLTFWTAGFDICYALLDLDFDRSVGLYSAPSTLGWSRALFISRLCFLASLSLLGSVGLVVKAGYFYYLGIMAVGTIFIAIQQKISPQTVASSTNSLLFLGLNTWVSPIYLLFVALDVFISTYPIDLASFFK